VRKTLVDGFIYDVGSGVLSMLLFAINPGTFAAHRVWLFLC
jgi:hypothetical protein